MDHWCGWDLPSNCPRDVVSWAPLSLLRPLGCHIPISVQCQPSPLPSTQV